MSTTTLRRIQKISLQVVMVGSKAVILSCSVSFLSTFNFVCYFIINLCSSVSLCLFYFEYLTVINKIYCITVATHFSVFFYESVEQNRSRHKTRWNSDGALQLQEPLIYCFPSSEHLVVQNIPLMVWLLSFTKILVRDLVRSFLESEVDSVKWVSFISVDPFKELKNWVSELRSLKTDCTYLTVHKLAVLFNGFFKFIWYRHQTWISWILF